MLKNLALLIYSYNIELCLKIQRSCKKKKDRLLIFVCISPILVLNTILKIIGERTVGALIISRIKEKEKRQTIEDGLSVVAIAKDEGEYIEEWLAYYKSVGVNHVYLYENNLRSWNNQVLDLIVHGMITSFKLMVKHTDQRY